MAYKTEKKPGGYIEDYLYCEHIIGYKHYCKKCKTYSHTGENIRLSECPICKYKEINKPEPDRCGQIVGRVGYMDSGKGRKERDNYLDGIKKNVKNKNHPDECYCDKHAGLHE